MQSLHQCRILVIGGMGFVGSHVVSCLLREGVREIRVFDTGIRSDLEKIWRKHSSIEIIEGNLIHPQQVMQAMKSVDCVFHLAAAWLGECVAQPRLAFDVNVQGTYNIIEASVACRVKRVVFSSSASVYGNAIQVPMTEEHPLNNRSLYGATKIAGEQFFRAFYETEKLPYVGLRYMNVYGPRMADKGPYANVIVKVLDQIERGKRPVIHGDGRQTFDFVNVEDVARANLLAMKNDTVDEFFNIGTGVGTSINELTDLLLRLTKSSLKPEYRAEEKMFVTQRIGSTEKASRILGFKAAIGLEEGLRSFLAYRRGEEKVT